MHITPLQRLQVTDGLLLNAEYWQLAHSYHRQRQNLYYQALNQPGIVSGLGVCPVQASTAVVPKYRDHRWLRIQPGLAIDQVGNPIVVPQAVDYRITAEALETPRLVYLVLSYVDPDRLQLPASQAVVHETFRVTEQTTPPGPLDIELCRLLLPVGQVSLQVPTHWLAPKAGEIDLRYRCLAQARSQGSLRVGVSHDGANAEKTVANLTGLMDALDGLYPKLQTAGVERVDLTQMPLETSASFDLLHMTYHQLLSLSELALPRLSQHLKNGGVLWVETPPQETNLSDLTKVKREIQTAIAAMADNPQMADLQAELMTELAELENSMDESIAEMLAAIIAIAERTQTPISGDGHLDTRHPLRRKPFRFGQFPKLNDTPLEILAWDGIVLVIGDLSATWGDEMTDDLPRERIRNLQELGINLLHYAWQRRLLGQWLADTAGATTPHG
ncbi:MAG: DUF4159 domain-containing protein [Cyanobacteria bacterium J06635_15]